ncbi:MAG TPA: tetratricopeptide repeat protein [Planctomycetota bacterium]|nr:tetratricopeptide repeat protein [Planctomycetota bacterium]
MSGKDLIQLRGEASPRTNVTIVEENATHVRFHQGEAKKQAESWKVRWMRRDGTPAEYDEALKAIPKGDWASAEKLLSGIEQTAPVALQRANVKRLRALDEGEGHALAYKDLAAWRAKNEDHFFAPHAALAAGEAALEAGLLDESKTAFEALAKNAGVPWQLLGRWGLARVMAAKGDKDTALADLEKTEKDALADEWSNEAAQLCRISRAEILASQRKIEAAAKLLTDVIELEAWAHTPAKNKALNLLGDLCLEMGGRQEDSAPNKEGLLAGLPFWLRVVRHAPLDPIERPRALHYACKASEAAGNKERAEILRGELRSRFASSRWTTGL